MRVALYEYLMNNCESIKSWHQPYTATAKTAKPYGVIVFGEDMNSVNRQGFFDSLYIWPYFDRGSYLAVDGAIKELKKLLNNTILTTATGSRLEVEYVNVGRDFDDDELKAITRRLEFRIPRAGK